MIGTTFSVKEAMRETPPMKMKPAITAQMMPMTSFGIPNAVKNASLIEFDWTMLPMKPRARMIATEKKTAMNLPRPPLKAFRM